MRLSSVPAGVLSAAVLAEAYLVAPPGPVLPYIGVECSGWVLPTTTDKCATLVPQYGITVAQFITYNPIVGPACTLTVGFAYCIQENFGGAGTTTTASANRTMLATSASAKPLATTTAPAGNGIATPTPIQAGMVTDCDTFYLVVAGDQCGLNAIANGITLAEFYAWNPAVGNACESLWAQYYVCVGVIGGTVAPKTTSPNNGVATPTPIQPGMITTCKKFHLVVSGDHCALIATAAGFTLANFYEWNPNVGDTCASLWLGFYVCIGV